MARLREAIGGAVLPARIASRAALFESVTTSPVAGVPRLDGRFIAPVQIIKIKPLKIAFIGHSAFVTFLWIADDRSRRRLVQFKLVAHLLETRRESFNLLLLLG